MTFREDDVLALLRDATEGERPVTPGGQLAVGLDGDLLGSWAFGHLDFTPARIRATTDTAYDLASLTKPLTALGVFRAIEAGRLTLDTPLRGHLDSLPRPHRDMTVGALLSHRSGLAAWAPLYLRTKPDAPRFGWVGSEMQEALLDTPIEVAVERYSDLGYLLLGALLEAAEGVPLGEVLAATLDGLVPKAVDLAYRLVYAPGTINTAPTERCPWRGRVVHGSVHDENAHAAGGVAGHAGVFGTAEALVAVGNAVLLATEGRHFGFDRDLARLMTTAREGGTYGYGWDTKSPGASSCGTHFSPRSFGHLGFTGTSLWIDPDRRLTVALVTNRVHPTRDNVGIRALRPRLHDAVWEAVKGL